MSTISAGTTSTTTLVATGDTTGSLVFKTNDTGSGGTTAMTIDTSQNVGIGTTSPTTKAQVSTTTGGSTSGLSVVASGNMLNIFGSSSTNAGVVLNATDGTVGSSTAVPMIFRGGGTESMRIDSSGRLLLGTTSATIGAVTCAVALDATTVNSGFGMGINGNASNTQLMRFAYAGTAVGSITVGASSTAYNTSSDYRLKHDIKPMTGALAKVAALKPVTYKWNVDDSAGEGFIAHELQEVCPDAVTGEKDAVDANGNPIYQGIDTSFIVATLTAAIQELKAELDATKAEVAALKEKI